MSKGRGYNQCLDIKDSWAFSDFDNSSGGESEKGLAMKAPNSSSNSPTDMDKTVAQVGQKRSRKGNNPKSDKTSGDGGESEHEMHIWTERERRKKMRNMFSGLHALLPQLPAKVIN